MSVYDPMEDSTPIKQWRASLDKELEASSVFRKEDLVRLIHKSQQSLEEIAAARVWLGEQERYVASMYKELAGLHRTRFNEEPPARTRKDSGAETVLDTTRKCVPHQQDNPAKAADMVGLCLSGFSQKVQPP